MPGRPGAVLTQGATPWNPQTGGPPPDPGSRPWNPQTGAAPDSGRG